MLSVPVLKSLNGKLNESADQLDISIINADKYLTDDKKIREFLLSNVQIEAKTDGLKLTVVKVADKGNLSDYIFSYKGNVLYSEEFDFQAVTNIKKHSIGASQFKLVFLHFSKLSKNTIPVGTELFIEFLMKKPTLSSNYEKSHGMVLIASSKCTYSVEFGKLKTSPEEFDTSKRDAYAKMLNIDVPLKLFDGVLGSEITFEHGIIYPGLLAEFNKRKNSMTWNTPEVLYLDIKELFLSIESKYGGKEEGIVIKYNSKILKLQQSYQVDQAARALIKDKFKAPEEIEKSYWEYVKICSLDLINSLVIKSRSLDDLLSEVAVNLKNLKITFVHPKKNIVNIKDDIQLSTKILLVKKLKGNNNALFLGKMRIITSAHYKIITDATKLYDNVIIGSVTSSMNKFSEEIRLKMIKLCFPNLEIVQHSSGNLIQIMNKCSKNINVILAGTDRIQEYRKQLANSMGMSVKEIKRTDDDISASKVIDALKTDDLEYFKANTPKAIHALYDDLKTLYGQEE